MLITAKDAKSTMEKAKSDRKEEFLRLFHEKGLADKFNKAVETEAKKGHNNALVEYPEGYFFEASHYFENELGYITTSAHRAGVLCVAWL